MKIPLLLLTSFFRAAAGVAQDSGIRYLHTDDAAINRATAACGSSKVKFEVRPKTLVISTKTNLTSGVLTVCYPDQ